MCVHSRDGIHEDGKRLLQSQTIVSYVGTWLNTYSDPRVGLYVTHDNVLAYGW